MEMWWLVLKLNLSQVTDVAGKENQESMADQLINMELEFLFLLNVFHI
jgi:hypothetical protein